jgi:hypothetical protein
MLAVFGVALKASIKVGCTYSLQFLNVAPESRLLGKTFTRRPPAECA